MAGSSLLKQLMHPIAKFLERGVEPAIESLTGETITWNMTIQNQKCLEQKSFHCFLVNTIQSVTMKTANPPILTKLSKNGNGITERVKQMRAQVSLNNDSQIEINN